MMSKQIIIFLILNNNILSVNVFKNHFDGGSQQKCFQIGITETSIEPVLQS